MFKKVFLCLILAFGSCSGLEWKSVNHPDFEDCERCLFYDAYDKSINVDLPIRYTLLRVRYEGVPVDIKYWISLDDLPKIDDQSLDDGDYDHEDWDSDHEGHDE